MLLHQLNNRFPFLLLPPLSLNNINACTRLVHVSVSDCLTLCWPGRWGGTPLLDSLRVGHTAVSEALRAAGAVATHEELTRLLHGAARDGKLKVRAVFAAPTAPCVVLTCEMYISLPSHHDACIFMQVLQSLFAFNPGSVKMIDREGRTGALSVSSHDV